jgi:hypothetical protein
MRQARETEPQSQNGAKRRRASGQKIGMGASLTEAIGPRGKTRYIGRKVSDRLKRLDPVATACDDIKVVFRTENADQAAQKNGSRHVARDVIA